MSRIRDWWNAAVYGVPIPDASANRPITAGLTIGATTGQLADYTWPTDWPGITRAQAMSVPSVKRARDIIVSVATAMPFAFYRRRTVDVDPLRIEPATWADRPDPNRTRQWVVGWTVDDLMFEGRAYWRIASRTSAGFPRTFELMRATEVNVDADAQALRWSPSLQPGRTVIVPARDVVEFLSPLDPLTIVGARAIGTALKLDESAERHAAHDVPSGWLECEGEAPDWVVDDDTLGEYLSALASAWHTARMANSTGALPDGVKYRESTSNPERLQLTEARQYGAVEVARLMDLPGFFLNAVQPGSSLTYQNGEQVRLDAIDLGAAPYIRCIEETLSGPSVTPLGQFVKLDPTEWLDSHTPALGGAPAPQADKEPADA